MKERYNRVEIICLLYITLTEDKMAEQLKRELDKPENKLYKNSHNL